MSDKEKNSTAESVIPVNQADLPIEFEMKLLNILDRVDKLSGSEEYRLKQAELLYETLLKGSDIAAKYHIELKKLNIEEENRINERVINAGAENRRHWAKTAFVVGSKVVVPIITGGLSGGVVTYFI